MTDLLDAVDALSKPVHVRVSQPILRTKIQPNGRLAMDPEGNLIREVRRAGAARDARDRHVAALAGRLAAEGVERLALRHRGSCGTGEEG